MHKFLKVISISALALVFAFGLTACGGAATTDNKPAANKPADNKPADNKPADNKPADNKAENKPADNKPADTASADKIGVPECDEYIEKYQACIFDKVPEAARAAYKTSFDTMKDTWKKTASNPQAKAALGTGCKQALDAAKTALASYGCKW